MGHYSGWDKCVIEWAITWTGTGCDWMYHYSGRDMWVIGWAISDYSGRDMWVMEGTLT